VMLDYYHPYSEVEEERVWQIQRLITDEDSHSLKEALDHSRLEYTGPVSSRLKDQADSTFGTCV
jgi:hypothetical protein